VGVRAIAYYRVSTQRQGESGLGLDAQREAVRRFVGAGEIIAEFEEIESGRRPDRPALDAALRECRLRKATLVIAKLDRLSRSVSFLSRLMDENIDFVAVDMPSANRLMVHIMAAFAEHERTLISERTKAALKAAKARGVKLGGLRHDLRAHAALGRQRSLRVRYESADKRAVELGEVIAELRTEGVASLQGLARALNNRRITAPRGGPWSAGQVRRTIARMGAATG
jgi:DNA invertase Pin-like site-specific DNA recombinase